MLKLLAGIIAVNLLLYECNTMRKNNHKTYLDADIYFNSDKISMNYDDSEDLILLVEKLLGECNDLYELIVTKELIRDIKQNEDYLEIRYPEKRKIKAGNFETIEIYNLFIPLSGKFVNLNQLSLFCGYPQYSSGPYVNSKGYKVLKDIIDQRKKDN